jgi:hypothetical protein
MKERPSAPAEQPLTGEAAALEADITPEMDAYHREWARQYALNTGVDPRLVAAVFGDPDAPPKLKPIPQDTIRIIRNDLKNLDRMARKRYLQNIREQGFDTSGIWKQRLEEYAVGAFVFGYVAIGLVFFFWVLFHYGRANRLDALLWPFLVDWHRLISLVF